MPEALDFRKPKNSVRLVRLALVPHLGIMHVLSARKEIKMAGERM